MVLRSDGLAAYCKYAAQAALLESGVGNSAQYLSDVRLTFFVEQHSGHSTIQCRVEFLAGPRKAKPGAGRIA